MTTQLQKAERFRELHADGIFVIPNPWDAGSARTLAEHGFRALATSSAASAYAIGKKDGELTRDEAMAHARLIVNATELPVSGDLGNGFGDRPEDVAHTIRCAAEAGLVGGSIEDATGDSNAPIYPIGLAVERIAAAVETARKLAIPFTVTGRCENFLNGRPDLDDTIERLVAYGRAGADVLFAPGLTDLGAVREVCQSVGKPVNFMIGMPGAAFDVEQLRAAGVRRVSLATTLYQAAMAAVASAAREIRDQGSFHFTERG